MAMSCPIGHLGHPPQRFLPHPSQHPEHLGESLGARLFREMVDHEAADDDVVAGVWKLQRLGASWRRPWHVPRMVPGAGGTVARWRV